MKIKFLKEYKFLRGFENDVKLTTTQIFKDAIIDTVEDEVPDEDVQWLIDNGFAEEVKESKWWKPKGGEKYYFVDDAGYINSANWTNQLWEVDRFAMGSCFKTNDAADRYREYQKAIVTVRQDEGVLLPVRLKRMEEGSDCAFYVGFDHTGILAVSALDLYENDVLSGTILFDTKGHAQASLDKHSDEWKIIANYDWSRE